MKNGLFSKHRQQGKFLFLQSWLIFLGIIKYRKTINCLYAPRSVNLSFTFCANGQYDLQQAEVQASGGLLYSAGVVRKAKLTYLVI